MIVHLDTSVLVDALTGTRRLHHELRAAGETGHRITFSTIVLFEWLRGPRTDAERGIQARLSPDAGLATVGPDAARIAAQIFRTLKRPRSREIDIAIAACAIEQGAALWTANPDDFNDIPGLRLYRG